MHGAAHIDPEQDRETLLHAVGRRAFLCEAASIVLCVAGLATMVVCVTDSARLAAIFIVALGTLFTIHSVSLDRYMVKSRRHPIDGNEAPVQSGDSPSAASGFSRARRAASKADEHPAPGALAAVAAAVCAVSLVGTVGLAVFSLSFSPVSILTKRTWTLEDGQWHKDGRTVVYEPAGESGMSIANGVSGNAESNDKSASASPTTYDPQIAAVKRRLSAGLTLFTGANKTEHQISHNNPKTDTDGSDALQIVSVTADYTTYGYYNGWVTLQNNTDESILYADVAITMISSAGEILKQETARCDSAIEPGGTGQAHYQISGNPRAAAMVPYTIVWYTAGEGVADDSQEYSDSTESSSRDFAATRTAPGTVFHKASANVPAIPM